MTDSFGPDDVLPDAARDPALPRRHGEHSAQGLAVTLVADYGLRNRAWLPAGALVDLLTEAGLTPGGARTTLSRLARRGVLESERTGRRASHRLTEAAAESLIRGGRRIAVCTDRAEEWDGRWTLVAFRLPTEQDTQRRILRGRLRWLGYAPLYDGLWVSPEPLSERAAALLAELSPDAMTSFRAELTGPATGGRAPLEAWDVGPIADRYREFLGQWQPVARRLAAGDVEGAEAVRARTGVMEDYRQFVVLDPPLPMRVMPAGWPRAEARQVFEAIYDGLSGAALAHVRATAARHGTGPRDDIVTHAIADLLTGRQFPAAPGRRASSRA